MTHFLERSRFAASLFYFLFIFCNSFIPQISPITQDSIVAILTGVTAIYFLSLLVLGWASDHLGHVFLMKFAALSTAFFLYPAFCYFVIERGIMGSVIFLSLFSILLAAYVAPSHAVMVNFFPIKSRYSRISFTYSMGLSLFGGTAPMFSMILFRELGGPASPTFYAIFCALLGLVAIYKLPDEKVDASNNPYF